MCVLHVFKKMYVSELVRGSREFEFLKMRIYCFVRTQNEIKRIHLANYAQALGQLTQGRISDRERKERHRLITQVIELERNTGPQQIGLPCAGTQKH